MTFGLTNRSTTTKNIRSKQWHSNLLPKLHGQVQCVQLVAVLNGDVSASGNQHRYNLCAPGFSRHLKGRGMFVRLFKWNNM